MSGSEEAEVPLSEYPREELVAALIEAARYGEADDLDLVAKIVAFDGSLVNAQDDQGRSPVHMCCANGHDAVLALLLQHSPDKSVVNIQGSTPLHFAAIKGSEKCVELLLKYGYNASAKDSLGRKPIDDCWEKGFQKVEDMLLLQDKEVEAELRRQELNVADDGMDGAAQPSASTAARKGYAQKKKTETETKPEAKEAETETPKEEVKEEKEDGKKEEKKEEEKKEVEVVKEDSKKEEDVKKEDPKPAAQLSMMDME